MFPLGTVLVPHQLLPFQVFEPRYRVLVEHCLTTDRRFGVVLIERGSEVGGGDVRFDVGTVAEIGESVAVTGRAVCARHGRHGRFRLSRGSPMIPTRGPRSQLIGEPAAVGDAGGPSGPRSAPGSIACSSWRARWARRPRATSARRRSRPGPGGRRPPWPRRPARHARRSCPKTTPVARLDRIVAALDETAELLELQLP